MNGKRKSTLGTREVEPPTRLKNLLSIYERDGSGNQKSTQRNSKRKQPRSNRVPTQPSSNTKERPVNRMLYKRTALKPANSVAVHKKNSPMLHKRTALKPANCVAVHKENSSRPESLKKLTEQSKKLLKNSETTSALRGGLEMIKESMAKAHAARMLSTPISTNTVSRSEILDSVTSKILLYTPLSQLTPQNLLFRKHKNDFSCSANQNDVPKRQYKSTACELLFSDTVSSQSKQKIFVENRMHQTSAGVTEKHFENENQENLTQECQKPGTNCLTADGLQTENTTNFFPKIQVSSPFQKLPLFLRTSISQNFTSACNSKGEVSESKPNSPRLNHILPLSFGHRKTPIPSQNISPADMWSSVELQASEPKPPCCNTENILNVPSDTNSALQRISDRGVNICINRDDKVDKAAALKEYTETVQGGACFFKEPEIMEIVESMLKLQEQCKVEMEHFTEWMKYVTERNECFTERMKALQNQQFEMLQKLSTVYRAAEERNECKHSTFITRESNAISSTDMNTERESVPIIVVSEKKKRRSSRIAAKINCSNHSGANTSDTYDKCTTVESKYTDLRKSFTFLRTPRSCKTPFQIKTPTRTPRTIVSTVIRDQLQLLYDSDSPQEERSARDP